MVNLLVMPWICSARIDISSALVLTWELASDISFEAWLTSTISLAIPSETIELWATFSFTSWIPNAA